MTKTLGEVFDELRKTTKHEDKMAILQKHRGPGIYYILKIAFNKPAWALPEGSPPFKPEKAGPGQTPSHLMRELRKLYLFLEGGANVTQILREKKFQLMLESLDKTEVEIILALKDGNFVSKFKCSKKLVDDTFPGLIDVPFTIPFLRN